MCMAQYNSIFLLMLSTAVNMNFFLKITWWWHHKVYLFFIWFFSWESLELSSWRHCEKNCIVLIVFLLLFGTHTQEVRSYFYNHQTVFIPRNGNGSNAFVKPTEIIMLVKVLTYKLLSISWTFTTYITIFGYDVTPTWLNGIN